jgi:uncharacterized protein (DUF302 family)
MSPGSNDALDAVDVVSRPSNASVAETLGRLEAAVRAKGLTVFARIDHAEGARSVGLEMQEAQVLVFGSPKSGTALMVARPLLALDLPMRALVWKDARGQVWVSYNAPAYYVRRYGLPDGLEKNLSAIEGLVSAAIEKAS